MKLIGASKYPFIVLKQKSSTSKIYPLFRDDKGIDSMYSISFQHGRSYIVGKEGDRYIISKGNGLCYTDKYALKTSENNYDVWGLLGKEDALRDYILCNEAFQMGIRTNIMDAVIELAHERIIGHSIYTPYLLQYSVKCPYRISDAPFMDVSLIKDFTAEWDTLNRYCYKEKYLIAADILYGYLKIMHGNKFLHNALTSQNITWNLELLDFELACSPSYPYSETDSKRHIIDLFEREAIHVYQIILDIANILREEVNFTLLKDIMNGYGFKL